MSRPREKITLPMHRILDTLMEQPVHMTAEEIQERLEDVGRATVYRALDRLTEEGMIHRLSLDGGTSVYEAVRAPHIHFQCRACGLLYDIQMDPMDTIDRVIAGSGHRIEKTDVIAYGICNTCQKQEKMEEM